MGAASLPPVFILSTLPGHNKEGLGPFSPGFWTLVCVVRASAGSEVEQRRNIKVSLCIRAFGSSPPPPPLAWLFSNVAAQPACKARDFNVGWREQQSLSLGGGGLETLRISLLIFGHSMYITYNFTGKGIAMIGWCFLWDAFPIFV